MALGRSILGSRYGGLHLSRLGPRPNGGADDGRRAVPDLGIASALPLRRPRAVTARSPAALRGPRPPRVALGPFLRGPPAALAVPGRPARSLRPGECEVLAVIGWAGSWFWLRSPALHLAVPGYGRTVDVVSPCVSALEGRAAAGPALVPETAESRWPISWTIKPGQIGPIRRDWAARFAGRRLSKAL
jgi:hypothetical protein